MPSKTIANTASEVLPANASRKSLGFINEDTTDIVFIKKERSEQTTVSSTDHDWKLAPGAGISFSTGTDGENAIKSRYTAIASANTPRISYFETEDITR